MKIESNKIYDFKKDFWELTGITKSNWEGRKKDLLEWLKNFYDYEIIEGRPIRIFIKKVYGEYRALPRKMSSKELTQQKVKDYETYTIAALGNEFKPNSKSKIAKDAIYDFGFCKYGHENYKYVANSYVREPFDKYGETNNIWVWVWASTYISVEDDILAEWKKILEECHISEKEAANAFYKQEQGEDISKEKSYYEKAQNIFKERFGGVLVKVAYWKCKA